MNLVAEKALQRPPHIVVMKDQMKDGQLDAMWVWA